MTTIRNIFATIGFAFTCLALLGIFGIADFRMCFDKPGQCQLASGVKGAAK